MIINPNKIPVLGHSITFAHFHSTFYWKQNIFSPNENVYLIYIGSEEFTNNLELTDIIPKEIYEKILKKTVKLSIINIFEGFIFVVNKIYDYFILKHNIPESSIYFLTEGYGLEKNVLQISLEKGKLPIKTYWLTVFEILVSRSIFNYNPNYSKKITDKKFIMFNKRWRYHRPLFVSLLKLNNLLNYGYVSFVESTENGEIHTWENFYNGLDQKNIDKAIRKQLLKNKNQLIDLKNLIVDTNSVHNNNLVAPFNKMSEKFYSSTYFSIVSETHYFQDDPAGVCLTEKIFKPIAFLHPFIVLSKPKTLHALKLKGYRTFSPYINEDYDNELDDSKRMIMILEEVKRLCSFSENERNDFINNVLKICKHNFNLLKSKSKNPVLIPLN